MRGGPFGTRVTVVTIRSEAQPQTEVRSGESLDGHGGDKPGARGRRIVNVVRAASFAQLLAVAAAALDHDV